MNNYNLKEVTARLKNLRELLGIDYATMAKKTDMTVSEYQSAESGDEDLSFNFLYNCANTLNCDITELITGDSAKLDNFTVTNAGQGMPIIRRQGFNYMHIASNLKGRIAEPFVVTVPYDESADSTDIELNMHDGQELDYILEGKLKVNIDGHVAVLNSGDSVYYNSSKPHGMVATDGAPCKFLAIVMKCKCCE